MKRRVARLGDNLYGLVIGVVLGTAFVACAGIPFPYKYYDPVPASFEGQLLGDVPEHDLPFSSCAPQAGEKRPCVVMMKAEFFELMNEYLSDKQALIDCQKPKP